MLAPSTVAFRQHLPLARVRIPPGELFCFMEIPEEFPIKRKKSRIRRSGSAFMISFCTSISNVFIKVRTPEFPCMWHHQKDRIAIPSPSPQKSPRMQVMIAYLSNTLPSFLFKSTW